MNASTLALLGTLAGALVIVGAGLLLGRWLAGRGRRGRWLL